MNVAHRIFRAGCWALAGLCVLAACSQPAQGIRIGAKNFAEQQLLAEMYAQLLENEGVAVERKFDTGDTAATHKALAEGRIDLYPEYTGTALVDILGRPAQSDPQAVFDAVSKEYKEKFKAIWLDRAPMNNTQAIGLGKPAATRLGLVTLSNFAAKANELATRGAPLRLAGPPDFLTRADGLAGLKKVYGEFDVKFIAVEPNARYRRLLDEAADVVVAFGTDGEVGGYDVALLIDDKRAFSAYNVAPVVREQTLAAAPKIREALNKLAPRLNDFTMRNLNFNVTNRGMAVADVAREFLKAEGLIK